MPHDQRGKKRKLQGLSRAEGSHDEVLTADVRDLLENLNITEEEKASKIPERFAEVEVTIHELSSTGDGLGRVSGSAHVYVVPFTSPGDVVTAKVIRQDTQTNSIVTDFVKVVQPSPDRQDSLVKCPYFSTCSGCQFQMLPYTYQLAHKKRVVERAYRNFSGLPASAVPAIGDTIGSPLQYGYRTKLTPHFDGPPGGRRAGRQGQKAKFEHVPEIGFMKKGTRKTLDIEECPIGTEAVQMGLRRERKRVAAELDKYSKGATILLRESTERVPKEEAKTTSGIDEAAQLVYEDRGDVVHIKSCITANNSTTTEYIDDFTFKNLANSFFQNNNSILPTFTSYIREHILPKTTDAATEAEQIPKITNLIDAYCGSGLFTVTLSSLFHRSVGIDIDEGSIAYAWRNARLNGLSTHSPSPSPTTTSTPQKDTQKDTYSPTSPINFLAADARHLFASVKNFPARATAVVLDPPRKGCDEDFLRQLLAFGPERIVYVSCNVHTQARDVGWILRGGTDEKGGEVGGEYEIESLVGFDFFPQTSHVEGVAVLKRKAKSGKVDGGVVEEVDGEGAEKATQETA